MKGFPSTAIGVSLLAVAALSGCAPTGGSDDGLSIVASTDVYGDIAARIAGSHAEVTSIITGSAQDPHSYEATARDQLALAKADIVIENGGGYDPFIDDLLSALGTSDPVVLTATELGAGGDAGHDHNHGESAHDHAEGANEHVWYDIDVIGALADEIAHHLAEIDPASADDYSANLAALDGELQQLASRIGELRAAHEGEGVAVTEPAPLMLFEQLGLVNRTPLAFSTAVEEGTDVSPAVLLEARRMLDDGTVRLLAHNDQTSGAETLQLVELAGDRDIPVIIVTETLPDDTHYVEWMSGLVEEIGAALA
jgi:zinc/manganese transport system substrate-binding protein